MLPGLATLILCLTGGVPQPDLVSPGPTAGIVLREQPALLVTNCQTYTHKVYVRLYSVTSTEHTTPLQHHKLDGLAGVGHRLLWTTQRPSKPHAHPTSEDDPYPSRPGTTLDKEPNIVASTEMKWKGTLYIKAFFLCLSQRGSKEFGQIELILVKEEKHVYFIVTPHNVSYLPEFGLYEVKGAEQSMNIMDGGSDLASFVKSALPKISQLERLLEALEELGVRDFEDMNYVQESDLLHILKPVEARRLLSFVKSTSQSDVSDSPSSNQQSSNSACDSPVEMSLSGACSSTSSNSVATSFTPLQLPDNSWYYKFEIPWKKMPSETIKKLDTGKRPTKSERLEIVRLIVKDILTICPTPSKQHISEIARKMAKTYTGAFSDVIEGMDIDDKAIASKCTRVVSYFKYSEKRAEMETIFREMETSSKNVDDVNTAGLLELVLKYFREKEDQMFHKVDKTILPDEVDCTGLPSTPCIIVCGMFKN
ncbi:hypothetical protein E1301_Tti019996 [Triplophysa tibetana]|uniref:Uncharacterized protein n=1 Tax=Triplophysa tibetana TaxID=1572043 RepID=A0A5A9NXV3_9TELE|nr:hypothetical protein E1301_Tti019996 [Triplophysa tibetana]